MNSDFLIAEEEGASLKQKGHFPLPPSRMRVFITAAPGQVEERIMIELQGDLEVPPDPAGQTLLFLHWPTPTTPVCLLGHQMIQGTLKTLEKPFLVIDTRRSTSAFDPQTKEPVGECQVVMVIKRRLLFHARPKPVLF
ncbi:Chromosome transmission fidelity protein 8-like protein [Aphelenchoides fujianensis]|nr:Chromosome transmission fidelity protein 8-like protein [Aphelenchoides fujianensis]